MPHGQPEKKSSTSKRPQRSRSFDMTRTVEVIDLTTSANTESSSSRKHDRNDQDHQAEGRSKRPKHSRESEPPMRKDTSMTPRVKRKKLKKEINNYKASRASNYQKLKETVAALENKLAETKQAHHETKQQLSDRKQETKKRIAALESKLADSRQAHHVTKQQLEDTEKQLSDTKQELKEMRALKHELVNVKQAYKNTKQNLEEVKQELKDSVEDLEGQLNSSRHAHHVTKQDLKDTKQELKDTKGELASNINELAKVQEICKAKSEEVFKQQSFIETNHQQIQSLKALVDDRANAAVALQRSCQRMEGDLKAKDANITAQREELQNSINQIAALKETLDEANTALKNARSNLDNCRNQLVVREEKLGFTERALEEARLAREGAEEEANALHLVNAKHGYQTHRAVLAEEKARAELKSERKDHKTNISALQEENTELQNHCAELQATIQRHNYKEPDEKIKKDFVSLESKIRQFVDKFARPVVNATDEELRAVWPNWSPKLRDFLAYPLFCNQVLEAYVWECLVARIFTRGSQIWAGELGQSLEKTLSMAAEEIDGEGFKSQLYIDLQYLRSSSSRLISRVAGANWQPEYFDSDVNTMASTLAKLIGLREITGAMQAGAMKIFESARDFEIQLRVLRAMYTVQMHKSAPDGKVLKYGFKAVDEDMEDRSPDQRGKTPGQVPLVDFITCPGLYKRGTNSGTKYGSTSCLIKMGVVCNATELCLKPGPSTPARPGPNQDQATLRSGKVRQQNECNSQNLITDSTNSAYGHSRPPRAGKGQGGGSARKKTKTSKGSDSDQEYVPARRG